MAIVAFFMPRPKERFLKQENTFSVHFGPRVVRFRSTALVRVPSAEPPPVVGDDEEDSGETRDSISGGEHVS